MDDIINKARGEMDKVIETLNKRFSTVRAGRANPSSLDGVMVEYYGNPTPLKAVATITVPEARILHIKPFDKHALAEIEKAIVAANLGYTPSNDGESIRIVIPELTEERRGELVKQVKAMCEDAKVAIRNARRDGMDDVKKAEFSEDVEKQMEDDIQELVNKYNKQAEDMTKEKETDLMSV